MSNESIIMILVQLPNQTAFYDNIDANYQFLWDLFNLKKHNHSIIYSSMRGIIVDVSSFHNTFWANYLPLFKMSLKSLYLLTQLQRVINITRWNTIR